MNEKFKGAVGVKGNICVHIFHHEKNKNNKTVYAVTGTDSVAEAVNAVIRFKKKGRMDFADYFAVEGVITDGYAEDGSPQWQLWLAGDAQGEPCMIVWKGEL